MIFTRIPENYSSLAAPAVYGFRNDGPVRTLDVEIVDARTGALLSAKRFFRAAAVEIDVAPVMRRLVRFDPEPTPGTGFRAAEDRCVRVFLRVEGVETPVRTFLASEYAVTGVLATTLPAERVLARDEQEELTLLPGAASAEVVSHVGNETSTRSFAGPAGAYPLLFRLSAADFAAAQRLTVRILSKEGNVSAVLRYALTDPVADGMRVAWHSRTGSLEHYTFPVRQSLVEHQVRRTVEGTEGAETVEREGEERLSLLSAYEPKAMLRALAGIGTASRVWVVREGGYYPVEPVAADRTIVIHGTLRAMELTLRPGRKGGAAWS